MNHLVWQVPMQTGSTRTGVSPQASPLGGRRADVWSGRSPGCSQKYLLHPSQGSSLFPSPTDQRCRNGVSARVRYRHGHSPLHHLLPERKPSWLTTVFRSKGDINTKCQAAHHFFVRGKTDGYPSVCVCAHLILHICPDTTVTQEIVTRVRVASRLSISVQKYRNICFQTCLFHLKATDPDFAPWILKWGHIMGDNTIWESAAAVGLTPAQESSWSMWPLTLCSPLSRHSRWLWSWQKDPLEELWGRDNLQVHKNKHSSYCRSRDYLLGLFVVIFSFRCVCVRILMSHQYAQN